MSDADRNPSGPGRSDAAMPAWPARPGWDEYFAGMAAHVATRGTCPRLRVGSVMVRDKRILVTGYNGSPSGVAHCEDVGCMMDDGHCQRAVHAEANAIVQAAHHGISLDGATAYVTHQPCRNCTKLLVSAGIKRVVYSVAYPDPIRDSLTAEAKLVMEPLAGL